MSGPAERWMEKKMTGPLNYFLSLVGIFMFAYVAAQIIRQGLFFRYIALACYVIVTFLTAAAALIVGQLHGFQTETFLYFYSYSDSLQTVCLYLALMELCHQVFEELKVSRYVRGASLMLLAGTAVAAWLRVQDVRDYLINRYVLELTMDLNFVGVVLALILWAGVVMLRETRLRLIQLSLAFGVYFSGITACYALANQYPKSAALGYAIQIVGVWLPCSLAFTFTKVPEHARLATARVTRPSR